MTWRSSNSVIAAMHRYNGLLQYFTLEYHKVQYSILVKTPLNSMLLLYFLFFTTHTPSLFEQKLREIPRLQTTNFKLLHKSVGHKSICLLATTDRQNLFAE